MKFIVLLLSSSFFLTAHASTNKTEQCTKDSDCVVGCRESKPKEADCIPSKEAKTTAVSEGPGECRTGPGGLRCGCRKKLCTYDLPAVTK